MNTSTQVIELLSQLVACPSVNPKGKTPTGPPFGEAAMVELLSNLLRKWGGKVEVREVSPGRPNLLACFPGRDPSRSLMLEAHSDTVAVEGMTIPPFTPTVRDGKLYGRGSCDTKGPMAAMLIALRRILDEDGQPPITVWFVSTCNEELGGTGAAALMKDGFRVDMAVVGEATEMQIVHAHKGCLRVAIETTGVAVHSSAPSRGVNAIYKMRPILERLEREVVPSLSKIQHPQLGSPTLSVGTITGGSQVNIVPDFCRIEIDRRMIPGESREAVARELAGNIDGTCRETEYYPPLEESPDSTVSKLVAGACQKVLGKSEFVVKPYATNAGFFKVAGIPSVVLGPGLIAPAHTKDEYIDLHLVDQGVDVYAEIIRSAGR